MEIKEISDSIYYIGTEDGDLDLFESQYPVPNGATYNSYLIMDEQIVVMDTADRRKSREWLANLENALGTREPDYLVISHMEPDHAATLQLAVEKYPKVKIVGNAKIFQMIPQFFAMDPTDRLVEVKEGDTLCIGRHVLQFFMAPMVHWPEVMVTYEQTQKILFSADAFGTFGKFEGIGNWDKEASRYYFNVCGKYGAQVQMLLKKVAVLDIRKICPLHGPVLSEALETYINFYDRWSRYEPDKEGTLVAYASIHGNTAKAAETFASMLEEQEEPVVRMDLSRTDVSYALAEAFRHPKMVLLCATYDNGMFPSMENFLQHLKIKTYQNRTVGLIENGSWVPVSGRCMKEMLGQMKNITIPENMITIRSSMKEADLDAMKELADYIKGV